MTLFRFDENFSYRIPDALRAIGLPPEVTVEHPRERDELGQGDVNWITAFAERGGRCVISGDEKMRDRPPERAALQAAGLVAFFPPEPRIWKAFGRYGQAAYVIRWFPVMVEVARSAEGAAHFRLPGSWTSPLREHLVELRHIQAET